MTTELITYMLAVADSLPKIKAPKDFNAKAILIFVKECYDKQLLPQQTADELIKKFGHGE
jgi:hypothetical protein